MCDKNGNGGGTVLDVLIFGGQRFCLFLLILRFRLQLQLASFPAMSVPGVLGYEPHVMLGLKGLSLVGLAGDSEPIKMAQLLETPPKKSLTFT